jgi:hypothetical protein
MDLNLLLVFAFLLLLLVVAGAMLTGRPRPEHLAHRLGPEYDRTREQRVQRSGIVPLPAHEAQRLRMEWEALQARFADSPHTAVAEADLLVREVMARRRYPLADFETRAADLSVDHPVVVEHYRAAHAIALRGRTGETDTESLRQAVVHYRALFTELLERSPEPARQRRGASEPSMEGARRAGFLRREH